LFSFIGVSLCVGVVSASGIFKLGEDALEPGLEAALFRRGEFFGDGKVGEAHEGLVDVLQAPFQHCGCGRAHRIG
jgi:hypothetical protein